MEQSTGELTTTGSSRARLLSGDAAIALVTALFIALVALLGLYPLAEPAAVPADAPPEVFASGRAMQHLPAIAREPHPLGSAEHDRVRDYLAKALTDLGLRPEVQQTTAVSGRGNPIAGTVQNVVARLPGTANSRAILLAAHYDSVLAGPGANDDGAAVAALLETARALQAGPRLKNDVIFLFTDGEEAGLLGSSAFVKEHPWAGDVGLALNFEARGSRGPVLMFETSNQNGWLVQEFARAAPYPMASSLFYDVYQTLPNDTDFTMFKAAGMAGFNFAYIDGYLHYHTAIDNLENVDQRSLQHHGSYALALARHFGDLSLNETRAPDAVYFNVLGPLFVHYPGALAVPLVVLALLLFGVVLVLGFRSRQLSFGGIVVGFLALLINLVAAPGLVALLLMLIFTIHPQYNLLPHGDTYNSKLYLVSFVALSLAIAAASYVLFRRRVRVYNLIAGALIWWLVLAAASSLYLPGGSYLFLWPLLFSLAGLGLLVASKQPEAGLRQRAAVILLCSIPGILLFAPLISMLFIALTIRLSIVVIVVAVLLLGLLVPHLTLMSSPRPWLLPIAAALVSVVFLVAGSLTSGFDAQRPRPDDVLYGLNADTGKAIWASTAGAPDAWTTQFFSGGTTSGLLADFFPTVRAPYIQSAAPAIALAAPEAALIDSSARNGLQSTRLRIRSARQASLIVIYVDPSVQVLGAAVDGKPIILSGPPPAAQAGPWALQYWAPPKDGLELTLDTKAAPSLPLRVVDRTSGLPDIAGTSIAPRPAALMVAPSIGRANFSNGTLVSKSFTFSLNP